MSRYPWDKCSGNGVCKCDSKDPNYVAKCFCSENYSGDVCQFRHIGGVPVDYDNDGTPDAEDIDDDNDGIEDFFEFEYVGSHKGISKVLNLEDLRDKRRASLCPRIASTYQCGKILEKILRHNFY